MRLAAAAMAALFVVAALLQLNDPDPVGWTIVYAAAALASGLAAARRLPWILAAITGAVALVWAGTLVPRVVSGGLWRDVAAAMGPATGAEEARECLGLLIVACWMAVLAVASRRRRRRR